MKKKKIFIIVTLFLALFQNWVFVVNSNFDAKNTEKIEFKRNFLADTSKWNFKKRDLKKEIKKRKKYHKTLLEKYNESFDEKYLNLISENSLILSSLRTELKN